MTENIDFWKKVIFTDKKQWNLQGNDGFISVWTKTKYSYSRITATNLRKGLMVWGAISASGRMQLICIEEKINSEIYQEMLENDFFKNVKDILPDGFIFQQDNAPPHSAKATKEYLEDKKIPLLEWPPCSPDLSPIENIWGIMTKKVYANGKTYMNVNDLWDAIVSAWHQIPVNVFTKLYESIPKCLVSVLEEKGKRIKF